MLPSEEQLHTQSIEAMYNEWMVSPHYFDNDASAFYQHMPTLRLLATNHHVLELGVRYGVSTVALLAGKPRSVLSVDVEPRYSIPHIEYAARQEGIDFRYFIHDDLTFVSAYEQSTESLFPMVDVTFIDTLHTYYQLQQELSMYAQYTRKFIVMHDVVSFGTTNEDRAPGPQGLTPAIREFLETNKEWSIAATYYHNNGLMILRRGLWEV